MQLFNVQGGKVAKLEALINEVNKEFKAEIIQWGFTYNDYKRIPFSSPTLNYMTYGGLPRDCIVEFAGKESSGKSTMALDIASNAQKIFLQEFEDGEVEIEKKVLYVDAENTLHPWWTEKLGVDPDKLVVIKPTGQSAEDMLEMITQFAETGEIGLIILDSIGALISKKLLDGEIGDGEYGGIAKVLSNFSQKMVQICRKHQVLLIGINQMYTNLNARFNLDQKKGGKGWKYFCSIQLNFRDDTDIDEEGRDTGKRNYETPSGKIFKAVLDKGKVFPPNRKLSSFTISFEKGVDVLSDLVEIAMMYDIISRAGAWYSIFDPETGEEVAKLQGKAKVDEYLEENEMFTKKLIGYLYDESKKFIE